jgi:hypothetical protein
MRRLRKPASVVVERGRVLAGEHEPPRGRAVEEADQVHERRLARSGRAHDGDELGLGDGKGGLGERVHLSVAGAVASRQAMSLEQHRRAL